MSDRQWEKLDGDAAAVEAKGNKYKEIAGAIERATRSLDSITEEIDTKSLAMDKTRSLAGDVREDIAKAVERYRATGEALVEYAVPLESAIRESEAAAKEIDRLETELVAARFAAYHAQSEVDGMPQDAPAGDLTSAKRNLTNARGDVEALETALEAQRSRWTAAKESKDRAASRAKGKIDEVVTGDKVNGLKDSTWDKVKHVAASLYEAFKIVCDVAGILAIFLAWVPGIGQALLILAAVGSILTIVESVVKFVKGDIGWGGLLLGVGLGVLGLFGGKLAGTLTKVAKARAVVSAASRTNSEVRLATRLAGNAAEGGRLIAEARTTVSRADELLSLKTILASPFRRPDAMHTLFEQRLAGNLTFLQGLQGAAKEAFVFPLKSPFGGSSEIFRNPALFHNSDSLAGAAVAMHLADFGGKAVNAGRGFAESMGGDNPWDKVNSSVGLTSPVSDGAYVDLAQLPGKVVNAVDTVDGWF